MPGTPIRPKQATSNPSTKPDPNVKIENPSCLDFPVYMMCFPHTWDTDDPNNWFMQHLSQEEIDENFAKAYGQWMTLYGWLSSENTLVHILPPAGDYPDQVYVANTFLMLCHLPKPVAVIANMQSPPRKGEEKIARVYFEACGYPVDRPPYTWEGEAELKLQKDNIYTGGYGLRTDIRALEWFEEKFDMKVVKCRMTDEKCYHWDCLYHPLTADKALVAVDLLEKKDVKEIEKVCEIIPVSTKLAHAGTTNLVRTVSLLLVASSLQALKKGTKEWDEEMEKEAFLSKVCAKNGLELVAVDLSEFEKSGAACSCLVGHINDAARAQPIV